MKRLLLAFIILGASLHAETIFHKKDGAEITPEEHKKLYAIMLKFQFPACTIFGTYVRDELKAMNTAIKKELPDSGIEATFMSNTLYDLFVKHFIDKNEDNIPTASSGVINESLDQATVYVNPRSFKNAVEKEDITNFHRTINNYIVTTLKERSLPIPKNASDSLLIVNTMNDNLWKGFGSYTEKDDPRNGRTIIKRAIEIDHLAYNANKFPLYRAATDVDIVELENPKESAHTRSGEIGKRSISFGSSLLGGYFFDFDACVFRLLMTYRKLIGYTLFIDKKSYSDGVLKNLFFIPPLTSLIDLLARGEFFHSRSKVPNLDEGAKGLDRLGLERALQHRSYYEIAARSPEHAEEIFNYIRTFIKNNYIMLTGNSPIKLPQPPNQPLPPFPQPKTVKRYPAPQQPLPHFPAKGGAEQKNGA